MSNKEHYFVVFELVGRAQESKEQVRWILYFTDHLHSTKSTNSADRNRVLESEQKCGYEG